MQKLSNTDFLTLGLTYSPGHSIGGKPTLLKITSNSQTSVSDTTTYPGAGQANLKLEIPTTFGVGLMYNHSNQLKVGLDYTLQKAMAYYTQLLGIAPDKQCVDITRCAGLAYDPDAYFRWDAEPLATMK